MVEQGERGDIIVVDDEAHIAGMVAEYLARQGYATRTASGGRALDRQIAEKGDDLIS